MVDIVDQIIQKEESGKATEVEVRAGMEIIKLRSQVYRLKNKTHQGYEDDIAKALDETMCRGQGRAYAAFLINQLNEWGLKIVPKVMV